MAPCRRRRRLHERTASPAVGGSYTFRSECQQSTSRRPKPEPPPPVAPRSAPTCAVSSRRSRRATICSTTSSASTSIAAGVGARSRRSIRFGTRPGVYIDLCAGTLDVASELSRTRGFRGLVLGTDFAEPMLRAGLTQGTARARGARYRRRAGAAAWRTTPLPAPSSPSGSATSRASPAALAEVYRVLEPGGRFVILEFSTPRSRVVRGRLPRVLPRRAAALSAES